MMQIEDIIAQTCDCHIHFGQFRSGYFSSQKVQQFISTIGIKRACIMPTGFYSHKEFNECLQTINLFPDEKYDKILWLSPRLLHWMPIENIYKLNNFKLIKIHFVAHPDWILHTEKITEVCMFAGIENIPIMFHTGNDTPASMYYTFCTNYPKTTFILAHGNPINEIIEILQNCPNVYVDTAFLPFSSINLLCKNHLDTQIIFGTDFPITNYFYSKVNPIIWYKTNIHNFVSEFGEELFTLWSNINYKKVII